MAITWNGGCGQGGGGSYIAGEGIDITGSVISAIMNATNTYTKEQVDALIPEYSAGDGISISAAKVISAALNSTNTYTKTEVDNLISALEHVRMREVQSLPATGESNIIYLVPKTGGGHDMYIWDDVNQRFVSIGQDTVDLSNYVQKTQLNTVSANGLVTKGSGHANKVWKTDASGNPAWMDDADTTYTGTAPINVSGTAISHNNSGVTAASYGPTANVTGTNNTTIAVPQITVDAKGHVTSAASRTLTNKDTTYGAATTSAAGLMSAAQVTKLNSIGAHSTNSDSVTLANNTEVTRLSLPVSGKTIVTVHVVFANNANGYRFACLNNGDKDLAPNLTPAVNGAETAFTITYLTASTETLTLKLKQTSGVSLKATIKWSWIRISN